MCKFITQLEGRTSRISRNASPATTLCAGARLAEAAVATGSREDPCVPAINCPGNRRGAPALGLHVFPGCFALQRLLLVSCPFSVLWPSKRSGDRQGKTQDYSRGVG